MNALVTGSNGTVGSALVKHIKNIGGTAHGWDRAIARPGDRDAARRLFESVKPTVVLHNALPSVSTGMENEGYVVNEQWTADIAALAGERNIPFLYTSTVMVFTNHVAGPLTPDITPDETEGYGASKRRGELAAIAANPCARVARIGWQIGSAPGSNNMIDFLEKAAAKGAISASNKWLPATSFLPDTAAAMLRIAASAPGVYHVGGNTRWSFFEIVTALNELHGGRWQIAQDDTFVCDQRLLDPRIPVGLLEDRLPGLGAVHVP